jgi:hypothetical protein
MDFFEKDRGGISDSAYQALFELVDEALTKVEVEA